MLVLTRKIQERVQIGDEITVTVLRVKGNQVRLGIDAPRSVRVVRGELALHETAPQSQAADAGAVEPSAPAPRQLTWNATWAAV